ncbi:MAG: AAA family ATPase [Nitrospiraceae bacterium]
MVDAGSLLALDLPVILVGRAMPGGVNYALLTLESLSCAGCRVEALVPYSAISPDNGPDARLQRESTAGELLKTQAGVPVFGPVPYRPSLRTQ